MSFCLNVKSTSLFICTNQFQRGKSPHFQHQINVHGALQQGGLHNWTQGPFLWYTVATAGSSPVLEIRFKEKNVSSPLTHKDSVLWRASVTER